MPDALDNKKPDDNVKAAKKPLHIKMQKSDEGIKPQHKVGLVEIAMILLLAGVIFIFIFGMNQMKREKAEELVLQQKFEQILPKFEIITKAAKAYQAADPFAAWPMSIEELNLPADTNSPEFKFSLSETGIITATSQKAFGKEGIKVNYDITKAAYEIVDPSPTVKPNIKDAWLIQ